MDTSSHDAKIQSAEEERARLYSQMENTVSEFIAASIPFFQKGFRETVDDAIKHAPETAQALGLEKLKELKSELQPEAKRLREKHAIPPSAARLCYAASHG